MYYARTMRNWPWLVLNQFRQAKQYPVKRRRYSFSISTKDDTLSRIKVGCTGPKTALTQSDSKRAYSSTAESCILGS